MANEPILIDLVKLEINPLLHAAKEGETGSVRELYAALERNFDELGRDERALLREALARLGEGEDSRTVFMPRSKAKRGSKKGRPQLSVAEKVRRFEMVDNLRESGVRHADAVSEVSRKLRLSRRRVEQTVKEIDDLKEQLRNEHQPGD